MSLRTPMKAEVLTVSDSSHRGQREDVSGPSVAAVLREAGFEVVETGLVPDELDAIKHEIARLCQLAQLVVTTGGTGIAPRDVTPEATLAVCARTLPGIAERIRAEGVRNTPNAVLSRAVCGVCGTSLVLNLPG